MFKCLVFIRRAEEVFAEILWGKRAYTVLRVMLFYRDRGAPYKTTHLSDLLKTHIGKHLKVDLGVQSYRHLAVALGRCILGIEIEEDVDETTTSGMDAAAGRTTLVSRRVYGIENDKLGFLNEQTLSVHRATDCLWHKKILKLDLGANSEDSSSHLCSIGEGQLRETVEAVFQEAIPAIALAVTQELKRQGLVIKG